MIILSGSLTILGSEFQKEDVVYSYNGNFKAYISFPKTPGPHPMIVYNYDQFIDWVGIETAQKKGYSLEAFMKEFNYWGYACMVPVERYRKLHSIKGAIHYVLNDKRVNRKEVTVIGTSEGAMLSLLATKDFPQIKSLVLIAIETINHTGALSVPNFLRSIDKVNMPMIIMAAKAGKKWRVKYEGLVVKILNQYKKKFIYKPYPYDRRWFWNPKNDFMRDLHFYLTKEPFPLPRKQDNESKNPY